MQLYGEMLEQIQQCENCSAKISWITAFSLRNNTNSLLPPANEVWGKVMFSQVFSLSTGGSAYRGSAWGGVRPPCGRHPGGLGRPPGTRKAGGTHPTGMLSFLVLVHFHKTAPHPAHNLPMNRHFYPIKIYNDITQVQK